MSRYGSARAILAGAALGVLAGCTGTPSGTVPHVPGQGAGSTSASTAARGASTVPSGSARPGTTAGTTGLGVPSKTFARANSIPFPVAVGNTWVYRTNAGGVTGQTTDRIVAAGPGTAGYQVTVSSTTVLGGTATAIQPVYVFYPDGTIGFPVPQVTSAPVAAGGVRWPTPAELASGRPYHSVLRVLDSRTGQYQNADVTVNGAGTAQVRVPAGSYQASVVEMTIRASAGTVEQTTWIAQGVGPVKIQVLVHAPGGAGLTTTSELLSYTKAIRVIGVGS